MQMVKSSNDAYSLCWENSSTLLSALASMKDPNRSSDRPINEYRNQEREDSVIAGLILGSVLLVLGISLVPQAFRQKFGEMVIRMTQ